MRELNSRLVVALLLILMQTRAIAHHGVAGLGAVGLEGPGAPIESTTSATLPAGRTLLYMKLDHARYETYDPDPASPESDYANFWIAGAGYGFTPWFSGYLFLPYHVKVDEPGGFDTRGFADVSVLGQIGFKYDEGWQLNPASESLDDQEDWHFTVFAGLTLPTGEPDLYDSSGAIDPGKSTGFGKPSYTLGMAATKLFAERWTVNLELSHIGFQEYTYDDGSAVRFGNEYRANLAFAYRAHTDIERRLRVDITGEAQYLSLGRDELFGIGEPATGGEIFYLVPGVRVYWDRFSAGLGVKLPVATALNEEAQQQGGEGREDYRILFTLSTTF